MVHEKLQRLNSLSSHPKIPMCTKTCVFVDPQFKAVRAVKLLQWVANHLNLKGLLFFVYNLYVGQRLWKKIILTCVLCFCQIHQ